MIAAAKGAGGTGRAYARLKRDWTMRIWALAKAARLKPVKRAYFEFIWREPARRRDPDNIAAGGRKLVLDGLVAAKVLPDDGWGVVLEWCDVFQISDKPGVLVTW
jgi:hypothetical protein